MVTATKPGEMTLIVVDPADLRMSRADNQRFPCMLSSPRGYRHPTHFCSVPIGVTT
jgi:hypothetical protein